MKRILALLLTLAMLLALCACGGASTADPKSETQTPAAAAEESAAAAVAEAAVEEPAEQPEEYVYTYEPLDWESVLSEVNGIHRAYIEEGDYSGAEAYLVEDPETVDLLSREEINALAQGSPSVESVTEEAAKSDVDLLFRALESAYGGYYYFGDEKFDAARAAIEKALDGKGSIQTDDLHELIMDNLDFMRDAHAWLGQENFRDRFAFSYYYTPDQYYSRDDKGYYKLCDAEKWYFESFDNADAFMALSLTPAGELVYAPVLWTAAAAEDTLLILKSESGETRSETIVWTKNRPYMETSSTNLQFSLEQLDGVSYISIRSFMGEENAFKEFIRSGAEVKDSKLIVFDLRSNGGGSDWYPFGWVGKFAGTDGLDIIPRFWSSRQSRLGSAVGQDFGLSSGKYISITQQGKFLDNDIPIVVLVDENVASAGEDALLVLSALDNVLVVGSNTGGYQMFGNVFSFTLPASGMWVQFGASLGFARSLENIEGKGYAPDVWCDSAEALDAVFAMLALCGAADGTTLSELRGSLDVRPADAPQLEIAVHGNRLPEGQTMGSAISYDHFQVLDKDSGEVLQDFTLEDVDEAVCTMQPLDNGTVVVYPYGYGWTPVTVVYQGIRYDFGWYSGSPQEMLEEWIGIKNFAASQSKDCDRIWLGLENNPQPSMAWMNNFLDGESLSLPVLLDDEEFTDFTVKNLDETVCVAERTEDGKLLLTKTGSGIAAFAVDCGEAVGVFFFQA